LIRQLRNEAPGTEIVVTTMTDDPGFAPEALAAGASGYVLKDDADRDLVNAVRRAARGESFITPAATSMTATCADGRTHRLSERQVGVLRLIALGHTNADIARRLQMSVRAVETNRSQILGELGLSTRAELVRYALRRGLLAMAPPSRLEVDS
jgi:DNA-binding NarL/FixJ family response regulator